MNPEGPDTDVVSPTMNPENTWEVLGIVVTEICNAQVMKSLYEEAWTVAQMLDMLKERFVAAKLAIQRQNHCTQAETAMLDLYSSEIVNLDISVTQIRQRFRIHQDLEAQLETISALPFTEHEGVEESRAGSS